MYSLPQDILDYFIICSKGKAQWCSWKLQPSHRAKEAETGPAEPLPPRDRRGAPSKRASEDIEAAERNHGLHLLWVWRAFLWLPLLSAHPKYSINFYFILSIWYLTREWYHALALILAHIHTTHMSIRHLCPLPIHHACVYVFPDKVNDPVMTAQIAWMMEVPQLYRECYDKPLQLQPSATGYKHPSLTQIISQFNRDKSY